MQRTPFRPPTMRHLVAVAVAVVVGLQPGDFAGHKSEIVFWHMNMLCIKRRRKTRPHSQSQSRSQSRSQRYTLQCPTPTLGGRRQTTDIFIIINVCTSFCLGLVSASASASASVSARGWWWHWWPPSWSWCWFRAFLGLRMCRQGLWLWSLPPAPHSTPHLGLRKKKDKLFMSCKFEYGEQGRQGTC